MGRRQPRRIAVIGGGPAGLRAAEVASESGASVELFDGKPSVGRKFLVAGKSGLNLTNATDLESFIASYDSSDFPKARWSQIIKSFDNEALQQWARGLGINTFTASSGKVFPSMKKAAPLLRRWVTRLRENSVTFSMNHRFIDFHGSDEEGGGIEVEFKQKGDSTVKKQFDAIVLALGGGSWPQTGSGAQWTQIFQSKGIQIQPLQADNCGWEYDWPTHVLADIEGKPLHNLQVYAEDTVVTGELLVTRYGFEGTPIYSLGRQLRRMDKPIIEIDFKPTFTVERLIQKMESAKRNFYHEATLRWKLSPVAISILKYLYGEVDSAEQLANTVKRCPIHLKGPRPIEEAISTSGGVAWSELDHYLMLKQFPGVYCAGEMIDWDAPTGGFLMQGCFATGTLTGERAALNSLQIDL